MEDRSGVRPLSRRAVGADVSLRIDPGVRFRVMYKKTDLKITFQEHNEQLHGRQYSVPVYNISENGEHHAECIQGSMTNTNDHTHDGHYFERVLP